MNKPDLLIKAFVEPMFGENAYLISLQAEGAPRPGWVIDPSFSPHIERLLDFADAQGITIEQILLTHGHGDHIAGIDMVKARCPAARLLIAREDQPMLTNPDLNLSSPFGVPLHIQTQPDADLAVGMEMMLGPTTWKVLDTSGHSPGGRSFYCAQAGAVVVGDALFAGSIGRTDFPGSDHQQLIANIRHHLLTLPGDTRVYSGHGPVTTIEIERKSNPFLSE